MSTFYPRGKYDQGIYIGGMEIPNEEYATYMFKAAANWFNDLIRSRGYLYLNSIYEYFNIPWNVRDENLCFKGSIKLDYRVTLKTDSIVCVELWLDS